MANSFAPESLRKQNELIRTLRTQLETTRKELADQKWLLEQYLHSPSWRITAPFRWIVRRLRALKLWIAGRDEKAGGDKSPIYRNAQGAEPADFVEANAASEDLKELYASFYRIGLETFLTSNALLDIPFSTAPEVSILLVLFNRAELTLACLRSIREHFTENLEVIIVDNASTDGTAPLLDRIRGARIVRSLENRNFLLAVNQAAREARGKYLLLLNNDAQLLPGSLRSALETIKSDDTIGAVGGRIILFDGSLQEAGSIMWRDGSCLGYGRGDNPFASPYMFRRDVDYCSAAFLLTPRTTWEQLGGFDEAFMPAYYEETDYCARLWEHGLRVVYEPAAAVLHYEFASSQSTAAAIQLQADHQQIFLKRHAAELERRLPPEVESIIRARSHSASTTPGAAPLRVLFIDDRVPHPWLGSGFPRARTMLLALRKAGFFVTLFPTASLDEDWAAVYSDLPREIEVVNEMGPTLLEAFLRHRHGYYNALVVSRPHNMNYLRPVIAAHPDWFEGTPIVYDAEALFAPRDIGLRQLKGERLTPEEIEKIYRDEIGLAALADGVMAVSEMDGAAFRSHGIEWVHILGHSLEIAPTSTAFDDRFGFLFVGAIQEETSPNGDSMIWFLSEIWPRIQSRCQNRAVLTIAGVGKTASIPASTDPSVRILGQIRDVTALYGRARVFVAPTRFAAGIPHKVHEAAARGVPVVVTSILARQLHWTDGVEVRVADGADAFAERCVELHNDPVLWTGIRNSALDAIRRECSGEVFEKQVCEVVSSEIRAGARKRYADAGMDR